MDKSANNIDTIAGACIAVRLRLLNRVVTNLYDDALRPLGLKMSQLNILVATARIGVARTAMSDEEWADKCLRDSSGGEDAAGEWAPKASFRYISGGYDDPETYRRLRGVGDQSSD